MTQEEIASLVEEVKALRRLQQGIDGDLEEHEKVEVATQKVPEILADRLRKLLGFVDKTREPGGNTVLFAIVSRIVPHGDEWVPEFWELNLDESQNKVTARRLNRDPFPPQKSPEAAEEFLSRHKRTYEIL